jgi:hypothetical protein
MIMIDMRSVHVDDELSSAPFAGPEDCHDAVEPASVAASMNKHSLPKDLFSRISRE